MAVRKLEHIGVMVQHMERSIAFYRDVLGLELLGTMDHPNGIVQLAFLATPGATETELELIAGYPGEVHEHGRVNHIAFTVDDLEAEIARLEAHNVTFIDPDITTLLNGAKYRFFYGPDGERLELFQPA